MNVASIHGNSSNTDNSDEGLWPNSLSALSYEKKHLLLSVDRKMIPNGYREQHHQHRRGMPYRMPPSSQVDERMANAASDYRPRNSHGAPQEAMHYHSRDRIDTVGSLESPETPILYTSADGMLQGHEPFLPHHQETATGAAAAQYSRRKLGVGGVPFNNCEARRVQQHRSTSDSMLPNHRRGYDVPPPIPTATHNGARPTFVTREPINGTRSRLARQDSLASYWLSCGSSISSVTTQVNRQAEFYFDWKNPSSQRNFGTDSRRSIPQDHLVLEPMPARSLEEERNPKRDDADCLPPDAAASAADDDENTHVVTDSDDSQPQLQPLKVYPTRPAQRSMHRPYRRKTSRNQMVDVGGGLQLKLRGADETLRAIRNDFYAPCSCSCCQQMLFCILDADYVICPSCRVVSPMTLDGVKHRITGGGVGLGFTMEHLAQYQRDITRQMP